MHQDLLDLFAEQLEKQDQLSKLTESEFLHQYGYSDVHSIDFIGNHDERCSKQNCQTFIKARTHRNVYKRNQ